MPVTEPTFSLVPLLAKAVRGEDLTAAEARDAFGHVVSGDAPQVTTGGLLAALQTKGLAPSEIAGGVEALKGTRGCLALFFWYSGSVVFYHEPK